MSHHQKQGNKAKADRMNKKSSHEVVSIGNLKISKNDLKDPTVQAMIKENQRKPIKHIEDLKQVFAGMKKGGEVEAVDQDQESWEDVEEEVSSGEVEHEEEKKEERAVVEEKRVVRKAEPSKIAECQRRAKKRTMKKNLSGTLNYTCLEDIEELDAKSGRHKDPNAFIDVSRMRANQFLLQNFINDVLPKGQLVQGGDRQIEIIMTRQKSLFPQQKQSLIIACEN